MSESQPTKVEDKIVEWVKMQLGHPILRVELTDNQIRLLIEDSIATISPWVVQTEYVTVPAAEVIDLSDHDVDYVIYVHKASQVDKGLDNMMYDPYLGISSAEYSYSMTNYSRMISTVTSMRDLVSNTMQSAKDNISWNYHEPLLYLDVGVPKSSRVTIEYSKKLDLETASDYYISYIKNYTLAYAKRLIGQIRSKFTVSSSPTEINGERLIDEANQELESLRERMVDELSTQFISD